MSRSQEDEDEKKTSSSEQEKSAEEAQKPTEQKPAPKPVTRPVIGKPIGTPSQTTTTPAPTGTPAATPPAQQPVPRPTVGRPVIGKPIGTPTQPTSAAQPAPSAQATPVVSPVVQRPTIGRPTIGTPGAGAIAAKPAAPATAPATPLKPTIPAKPVVSKAEVSRRNFIKAIAVAGGLVAAVQFGLLGPYLQGTVGSNVQPTQVIHDSLTNLPLKTTDIAKNDWKTFIWPRTGDPNIDNDTFSQCVVVHLPDGLTAPADVSAKDPIGGGTFIAFSRVCVHLWCLWSYVPNDQRGECPCHGSQYVPGTGAPWNKSPGTAVLGPASLQTPPNNQLPIITLKIASDGTISATGLIGSVGCGQKC